MQTPKIDTKAYDKTEEKLQRLYDELAELGQQQKAVEDNISGSVPWASEKDLLKEYRKSKEWNKLQEAISRVQGQAEKYENELEKIAHAETTQTETDKYKKTAAALKNARDKLAELGKKTAEVDAKQEHLVKTVKDVGRQGEKSLKKASKAVENFAVRLRSIVAGAFIFNIISAGLRGLTTYLGNALKTNKQFAGSMSAIKGNLLTAFQPIYEAVLPALNAFMAGLQKVTGYIASFINMLFGKSVAASQKNAEALYQQASALDDVSKSAKAANKQLSKIDDLNVISKSEDNGGSSQSSDVTAPSFETIETDDSLSIWMKKILSLLEPLKNSLENLWNNGLAKFKDFSVGALSDFYNSFLKPIGEWTIGTGLPSLVNSFNKLLNSIKWNKLRDALNKVWKALEPFAENVGEGLLWFVDNILVPLGAWVMNDIVPVFLEGLSDVIDILNQSLKNFKSIFQWLWDNVLAPLAEWTGGVISTVFSDLAVAIDWISQNEIAVAILDGIVLGILAWKAAQLLLNAASFAFNAILNANPITWLITIIAALVVIIVELVKHWDDIKAAVAAVWEKIQEIFGAIGNWFKSRVEDIKNAFAGLGDWFKSIFTGAWEKIKEVFGSVKSFFSGVLDGIKSVFTAIPDWFKSVFSTAWQKVKDVFSAGGKIFDGIKDGIVNTFKTVVNALIKGINKVIAIPFDAINGVLKKIKGINILGFKPFDWVSTFNVPQIPYLASGAVIPPNKKFMAVLGDQKSGMNIEAPAELIKQMAKEAIEESGGTGEIALDVKLYLEGDAQGVFKLVRVEHDKVKKQTGRSVFA